MTRTRDLLGLAALCIVLAGCATHHRAVSSASAESTDIPDAPEAPAAPTANGQLTLDSPVGQICDDPRGRAVLDSNLPNLRKNPNYFLFKSMSLRQLASMSGGKITSDKLERVRLGLAAISGKSGQGALH
jgi:hypothetical protein